MHKLLCIAAWNINTLKYLVTHFYAISFVSVVPIANNDTGVETAIGKEAGFVKELFLK